MLPQQTESLNRMNAYMCQSDTNMCRCTLVAYLCILENRTNTEGDAVCLENNQRTPRVEAHVARSPSNLTLRVSIRGASKTRGKEKRGPYMLRRLSINSMNALTVTQLTFRVLGKPS